MMKSTSAKTKNILQANIITVYSVDTSKQVCQEYLVYIPDRQR